MAKKVIQMYDKYKSTTKIYPKVIKECFQDDAKEYIEGQVVANPTLAGTEASLTSLEVGGTKYKVEQPINVEANPTLAGTEADLESIEIGDTKYKVGGGKQLYRHNVSLMSSISGDGSFVIFSIINDSNEEVNTVDKARTILYNAGFLVSTNASPLGELYKYCACSGYSTNNSKYITGVASRSGAQGFVLLEDTNYETITSLNIVNDNIKAL